MLPTVALDPDHWLSIKKLGSTSDTTGTETATLQYSTLLRFDIIEQNTSEWDELCSFALLQAQKSMDIFAVQYPYNLHIYIRWSFEALVGKITDSVLFNSFEDEMYEIWYFHFLV